MLAHSVRQLESSDPNLFRFAAFRHGSFVDKPYRYELYGIQLRDELSKKYESPGGHHMNDDTCVWYLSVHKIHFEIGFRDAKLATLFKLEYGAT